MELKKKIETKGNPLNGGRFWQQPPDPLKGEYFRKPLGILFSSNLGFTPHLGGRGAVAKNETLNLGALPIIYLLLTTLLISSCRPNKPLTPQEMANDYHAAMNQLTEVIIYDIFSPPVASRIYAYSNLAAFEAMSNYGNHKPSMAGKINQFPIVPNPLKDICPELAGIKAFLTVARALTFSVQYYDDFEKPILEKYKNSGMTNLAYENSLKYGELIGNHVIAYSKTDNYAPTRGQRYTLKKTPGTWEPTPPAYADAIEPNWGKIRPLTLDSAAQFTVAPNAPYSLDKKSAFWKELDEVFTLSKNLTEEQKRIAWFWDDNAFVTEVQGHAMSASKKMTPGGHWLAITQKICQSKNYTAIQAAQVNFWVSTALFDGFIACWKVKYQTHRIRPETVINANLDKDWTPYLQTPPFPEYPSGHSTISAASAEVLSSVFGDNVAFIDSTEYVFGHGVGQFTSFRDAAKQASISRLYGGIHYRSGCDAGLVLGEKIGKSVVEKLKIKVSN
jgi:hypothetical protein